MKRMPNTKKRLEILEHLRNGGFLESHIAGWYECSSRGGVKLRVEDWLEATGELVEVTKNGKYIRSYRIYHKDKVPSEFRCLNEQSQ